MELPCGYGLASQFQLRHEVPLVPPVLFPSNVHMLVSHTLPVVALFGAAGSGVAAA
jgi:hypothetical protein